MVTSYVFFDMINQDLRWYVIRNIFTRKLVFIETVCTILPKRTLCYGRKSRGVSGSTP